MPQADDWQRFVPTRSQVKREAVDEVLKAVDLTEKVNEAKAEVAKRSNLTSKIWAALETLTPTIIAIMQKAKDDLGDGKGAEKKDLVIAAVAQILNLVVPLPGGMVGIVARVVLKTAVHWIADMVEELYEEHFAKADA